MRRSGWLIQKDAFCMGQFASALYVSGCSDLESLQPQMFQIFPIASVVVHPFRLLRILKWIDMTFPGPSLAVPEDTKP